jgi:hypothetical protein
MCSGRYFPVRAATISASDALQHSVAARSCLVAEAHLPWSPALELPHHPLHRRLLVRQRPLQAGFVSASNSAAALIATLCASNPMKVIPSATTGSLRTRLWCRGEAH